jgi:hypothetical protein
MSGRTNASVDATEDVVVAEAPCDKSLNANARSVVDWNRAAGDFSRHRSTMRTSEGGSGRPDVGTMGDGASRRIADIVSSIVSDANARYPVSIS